MRALGGQLQFVKSISLQALTKGQVGQVHQFTVHYSICPQFNEVSAFLLLFLAYKGNPVCNRGFRRLLRL